MNKRIRKKKVKPSVIKRSIKLDKDYPYELFCDGDIAIDLNGRCHKIINVGRGIVTVKL